MTRGDRILVTGASGFIGSFIVEEALRRGLEVWAAVRPTSSRQYLKDERIKFMELNLGRQGELEKELRGKAFDYVVHAAGVTKSVDTRDFRRINAQGTIHLVNALRAVGTPLKRFVYMSSLSVVGPVREEQPYEDIRPDDTPQPNTAYGRSKLESELYLASLEGFPYIVLRPTGVYGPREKDYYLMAKSISRHVDFAAGLKPQEITFVYVKDVVQAVMLALEKGKTGGKYFISDGGVYDSRTFSDLIRHELGDPWVLRLKSPLWLLRIITFIGEYAGRARGTLTALNNDKYNILRQRNWRCDITAAREELGYVPEYELGRGVGETIRWYKDNGWL